MRPPILPSRRARAMAAATVAVMAAGAAVAAPAGAVDTGSKLSVGTAYLNQLVPAERTPIGWTGSVSGCKAGATSAAQRYATRTAINVYRAFGGLKPVRLDAGLSAKAQRAALMMQANGSLSHAPPSSWRCWSSAGRSAAGSSNLALGMSGAAAISGYMRDPGAGNTAVGHRRWIMFPPTTAMGSGSTSRANALWVFGGGWTPPAGTPSFVSWPTAGYVPTQLEPGGRWSLSATDPSVRFARATVKVRTASGTALRVVKQPVADGYGNNTIVFQVSGLRRPSGSSVVSYRVTVSGITRAGSSTTISRSYTVKLFDPTALPRVKNVSRAWAGGTFAVGRTLTAKVGRWTPSPTRYTYRWLRNGVPISGATHRTYKLVRADRGDKVSVRVTAKRSGRVSGVSTSAAKTVR